MQVNEISDRDVLLFAINLINCELVHDAVLNYVSSVFALTHGFFAQASGSMSPVFTGKSAKENF